MGGEGKLGRGKRTARLVQEALNSSSLLDSREQWEPSEMHQERGAGVSRELGLLMYTGHLFQEHAFGPK